jgi:hypothetical protein
VSEIRNGQPSSATESPGSEHGDDADSSPELLWSPSEEHIRLSNLARFERFAHDRRGFTFADYDELHHWSAQHLVDFWADVKIPGLCGVVNGR